jgi:hypothetical protein
VSALGLPLGFLNKRFAVTGGARAVSFARFYTALCGLITTPRKKIKLTGGHTVFGLKGIVQQKLRGVELYINHSFF